MKRAWLLCALLGSSCLDFDAQLERCRDAGTWICAGSGGGEGGSDAGLDGGTGGGSGGGTSGGGTGGGAGGGSGGGGGTGGGFVGTDDLICNHDWCWDHPRPTGVNLKAVWGNAPNDLWVAGESGTVMHFDGATWTSHGQDPALNFNSICGHGTDVYFGADIYQAALNFLHKWDGTSWTPIGGTYDVYQLVCGAQRLLIADQGGAAAMDWTASQPSRLFTPPGGEYCVGIAETAPDQCVVACRFDGVSAPFVRMRGCDGGLEYELLDTDGGLGPTFFPQTLWTDPVRGVLAGIFLHQGEIWQRDAGWGVLWSGNSAGDIYGGAPSATGSIVVGGYGLVLDITAAGIAEQRLSTSGNSYLTGVWSPPSGNAWAVGERGCIMERIDGGWLPRSSCAVGFEDLATEPALFAITEDELYRRADAGWVWVKDLPLGQIALWERPDGGGFAHLTHTGLYSNATRLPLALTDAQRLAVVSDQRVVISTESGLLIDTTLDAGARLATFDAGVTLFSLVADPADGTVWASGSQGTVWHSTAPGRWTAEATGLSGDVTEVAVGFGRVWAVNEQSVATRTADGGWSSGSTPDPFYSRVVPVSPDEALLFRIDLKAARITSGFALTAINSPPTRLSARLVVRGDELWGLGPGGGIVRYRFR